MGVGNSQYMESHKIHVQNHQPAILDDAIDYSLFVGTAKHGTFPQ
jgi:hypothetical protein